VKLQPALRLMRIPNVFTAFANVAAGVCLARSGSPQLRDLQLVLASGALYCAGMVWNDYCDRDIDAVERPERPIPAGTVSPTGAAALGGVLLGLGLILAAWHGPAPLWVAALLALSILLYDTRFKSGPFGPFVMGTCRALNVLLGLSAAIGGAPGPAFLAPLVLGMFTLLITQLSRFEVEGTEPARLRGTLRNLFALAIAGALALLLLAFSVRAALLALLTAALGYAFVIWRGRQLFEPLRTHVSPPALGRAIGGGILLMPALDAAFVAAAGLPLLAAGVFALAGPAYVLKRWFYLT
jgi:4-hydroxybenzoate polyprenyltransferase